MQILELKEIHYEEAVTGRERDLYSPVEGVRKHKNINPDRNIQDIIEEKSGVHTWENQGFL